MMPHGCMQLEGSAIIRNLSSSHSRLPCCGLTADLGLMFALFESPMHSEEDFLRNPKFVRGAQGQQQQLGSSLEE